MGKKIQGDIEEEKMLASELSLLKKEVAVGYQPVWESSSTQLDLLPINAFEFHASWALDHSEVKKALAMLPGDQDAANLIIRAMDEGSETYHDYLIDGAKNKGNFSLSEGGWNLSCSLGVLSEHGQFRPMIRSKSIQLPEVPFQETKSLMEAADLEEARPLEKESFEGRSVDAINPVLDEKGFTAKVSLPHWLPDELRYIPSPVEEDDLDPVLNEPIRSEFYEEPAIPVNETEVLDSVIEDLAKGVYRGPVHSGGDSSFSELSTGADLASDPQLCASWSLASQSSDDFEASTLSIRAFLILEGGMDPSLEMVLCGQKIEPEVDGSFSYEVELKIPGQIEQLLRLATEEAPAISNTLTFAKKGSSKGVFFELNSKLRILGKISDQRYVDRLAMNLNLSHDGRFVVERALPQGALFLSGIGVIPLEEKE